MAVKIGLAYFTPRQLIEIVKKTKFAIQTKLLSKRCHFKEETFRNIVFRLHIL